MPFFHSTMYRSPVVESLRIRDFRWLWFGSFISFMAMNMQIITRGWLILRLTDDSPLALSLVMVSFALPLTFVSLIGGAVADRVPRKYITIGCLSANTALTFLLATLDLTNLIEFWHLLATGFLNGSLMAFNIPSRDAMISEIVPEENLVNAISLNSSGMNLTRVVGPAAAGLLIIYMETSGVFYLISCFYAFSVLSMIRVHTPRKNPKRSMRTGVTADIREGLTYLRGNTTLRGLLIMGFIPVLFGYTHFALLPAWAREALNVESDGLGLLMTIMGIGALTGTLTLASMRRFNRRGLLLLLIGIAWGFALAFFSQSTSYVMSGPFLFLIGFLSSVFMSQNMGLMQVYAVPEMRGRMVSIGVMTFGAMPLSSVPFGAIAEKIGTPNTLGLSGLLLVAAMTLFAVVHPKLRRIA